MPAENEKYMKRCLELAAKGLGRVAPNPMVGCVIVHRDRIVGSGVIRDSGEADTDGAGQARIIGEGFHWEYGKAHAEVNAINTVQDQQLLRESTLYVNLEPCSHHGKTPPCSQLIIEKGIPNIVIGTADPNRLVAGNGIKALEDAGRNVTTGILQEDCIRLNRRFFTFHQKKRPYVILKWAQTKDGFIDMCRNTPEQGKINWITDEKARTMVHKWRSEEQAILVGSETVLKDNPLLTVREWPGRNPLRIIVDRRGRVTSSHSVMDTSTPTLVLSRENKKEKNLEWIDVPAETVIPSRKSKAEKKPEWIDASAPGSLVPQILNLLYQREIQSLIIEGGAFTVNRFIESGMWDEARVFTGPIEFSDGVKAPQLSADPAETIEISNSLLRIYYNREYGFPPSRE
jgi:diaminohydroxyphosphoribosylaminopyrimidine deaminase/5-amino-6-(5-phosphoribosylamino)uracil reductase